MRIAAMMRGAHVTLGKGALYMVSFGAPRLHYYDASLADFRALADSATLPS